MLGVWRERRKREVAGRRVLGVSRVLRTPGYAVGARLADISADLVGVAGIARRALASQPRFARARRWRIHRHARRPSSVRIADTIFAVPESPLCFPARWTMARRRADGRDTRYGVDVDTRARHHRTLSSLPERDAHRHHDVDGLSLPHSGGVVPVAGCPPASDVPHFSTGTAAPIGLVSEHLAGRDDVAGAASGAVRRGSTAFCAASSGIARVESFHADLS
jgi:hypothetical protein